MSKMTVHEWLELGIAEGFCTEVACEMHEGGSYWTDDEINAYEQGDDPCIPIVRVWEPEEFEQPVLRVVEDEPTG